MTKILHNENLSRSGTRPVCSPEQEKAEKPHKHAAPTSYLQLTPEDSRSRAVPAQQDRGQLQDTRDTAGQTCVWLLGHRRAKRRVSENGSRCPRTVSSSRAEGLY